MLHFSFDFNLFNSNYFLYERFLVALFSLVPSVLLVLFILYTDRKSKEPAKNIILCLLSGVLTIALSQYFESLVMPYFSNNVVLTYIWATIEELSKACIFFLFLFDNKYFDDIYDGIVYMALIALSFAGLENIMYAFSESTVSSSIALALMRDFTTIPLHVICGIIIGFFFSLACFSKDKKSKYINIFLSIFFAAVVHGTFNNLMSLLSTFKYDYNNSFKVIFFMVLPLLLIMVGLFVLAIKVVNKTIKLNEIFINNGEYEDGYKFLMNSDEYKNSDSGKRRLMLHDKLNLYHNKVNKEDKSDELINNIDEKPEEKPFALEEFEVDNIVKEEITVLEPKNEIIQIDESSFENKEIEIKREESETNNQDVTDDDIMNLIDEEIEKELNTISVKPNKKKSNAKSKQRRKYYAGNNRR